MRRSTPWPRVFQGLQMDTSLYRPADYIDSSFDNLGRALVIGGILLLLVLGAFFFDWRSALIGAVSIVTSLGAAWLVLYVTETTVNTMVLAGLVMALAIVIDDAIVDLDNAARRLRGYRADGGGAPAWEIILDASLGMRRAMLYATLIVAAVLLPTFFLEGDAGAFLPPIAVTYLLAVGASMLVALTVTPALGHAASRRHVAADRGFRDRSLDRTRLRQDRATHRSSTGRRLRDVRSVRAGRPARVPLPRHLDAPFARGA